MKRKITALFTAFLMTLLASCGTGGAPAETTAADSTSEASTETQPPVEIVDYKGEAVKFYLWSSSLIDYTEETGDVINDAIYRRNRKVEDLYNVKFEFTKNSAAAGDFRGFINVVNGEIMAGSDSIGLVGAFGHMFAGESINGNYFNLNDYIDFSKEWWPSNIDRAGNVGDKMFCAFGNMETRYYDQTYAIFFNKRLAEECQVGSLYELVKSGKWTMDKLGEVVKQGGRDLNGDTELGEGDQFGMLLGDSMHVDAFVQSFDLKITEPDSNGYPVLLDLTERYVDAQKRVNDLAHNTPEVRYDTDNIETLFKSGQALLTGERMGIAHTLREMNDDFGIIPYPKWDEAQERYITYNAQGNSTAYAVPLCAKNPAMNANILDALAYYGYVDVLPEYYERALKGKSARDSESEEMLDIIFNNIEYDFTQIYAGIFTTHYSPATLMRDCTFDYSDISSKWASAVEYYREVIGEVIASLK